ncbi:MAG: DUF6382 domain-containing protein [Clostridium sp.]|nr:DUF6382 domain-containing protein [Clostridium sp.]
MKKASNKIKKIEKNNLSFLEIKSIKGQQLNLTEVEAVTKNKVEGLLPLSVKESGSSFKLIYNVTGMISLNQYLKTTQMNKQLFGFLLQNIFNIWKIIETNYFQHRSLLLSFGKVKVEPSSKRLYFIYVPIQYYDNETTLKDFLLKIIQVATFSTDEDLSFVQEYLRILNTGVNFSIFELEQYIESLTGKNMPSSKMKKCPNCGREVSSDANFCPCCQYSYLTKGVTGSTNNGSAIYNPLDDELVLKSDNDEFNFNNDSNFSSKAENETVFDTADADRGSCSGETDNIGTTVLGDDSEDEDATTVLNQPKRIVKVGYLTRISNGEKKKIDKNIYHVGKSLKNDFSVTDNNAVSRQHALFIIRDEKFYINDQNSTNKTYLNGKVIAPKQDVELVDETKITLANENFIFNIITIEE